MWFYIILFLYCVFTLLINNKVKRNQKYLLEISTIVILCIISGTRYYLGGTDYYIYKIVFDGLPTVKGFIVNFSNIHIYYTTFGMEAGYLLFNSIVKSLHMNFFGFTLIHSIIFYFALYYGLKRYSYNFNIIIIVFLYKLFFYNTFISMRQSITVAIFFIAIHFIEERKAVKYFSSITVALFFHSAAFILFPLYFINRIQLSKNKIIIANLIFIPTILISFLNIPVARIFDFMIGFFGETAARTKAEGIIYGTEFSSIGIFHTLEYFVVMLLVIVFYNKLIQIDKHSELILKLFLILLPLFTLFRGYEILTRTKDYFILTYAIIVGYLCLINDGKYKFFVQICMILICAYGFFRFILFFDGGAMLPYRSFIFDNK